MAKVKYDGHRIMTGIRRIAKGRVTVATRILANDMIRSISRPNPSGRFPSAPGEPPKMVTGELIRSIKVEVAQSDTNVVGMVMAHHKSKWLDEGTVRMLPRPFTRPSVRRTTPVIKSVLAGES